jgi:ATP-dependent Clp protease ATP-binding subunit ClpB
MYSLPENLDEVNRRIIYLETEKAALSSEKDQKSIQNLKITESELKKLKDKQASLNKE